MDKLPESMFVETEERRAPSEACVVRPAPSETWKPPYHRVVRLSELTAMVPAPSWYNNISSDAIRMPARVQKNASCGLHAVNHLLACSSHPVVLHKDQFEECGLRARIGDSPTNLVDPATGNYDVAVLHANLVARNLGVFPMTAADIEGTEGRTSLLSGSRLEEPFREHVDLTGSYKAVGYLLRVPVGRGHWITLLPGRAVTSASCPNSVLCDSLHPHPFLLPQEEMEQLLQACASDSATGECGSTTGFVCFLVGEAEPRVDCGMLFQVAYGAGDYATELARLCREHGVTHTSSCNYKVQGSSGKKFRLSFYEQPQLEPDVEKTDFPLMVWRTRMDTLEDRIEERMEERMETSAAHTLEERMDTLEEAQLQAVLVASAIDVRQDLPLAHEVRPPLPCSPVLKLHQGSRAVR